MDQIERFNLHVSTSEEKRKNKNKKQKIRPRYFTMDIPSEMENQSSCSENWTPFVNKTRNLTTNVDVTKKLLALASQIKEDSPAMKTHFPHDSVKTNLKKCNTSLLKINSLQNEELPNVKARDKNSMHDNKKSKSKSKQVNSKESDVEKKHCTKKMKNKKEKIYRKENKVGSELHFTLVEDNEFQNSHEQNFNTEMFLNVGKTKSRKPEVLTNNVSVNEVSSTNKHNPSKTEIEYSSAYGSIKTSEIGSSEESPFLDVSGKNAVGHELLNSKPIFVEMEGKHTVPSNPIHEQISDLKSKRAVACYNKITNWRPSNVSNPKSWEVHFGSTDRLCYSSNLRIDKEVTKNITLAESKIEKSLLQLDQENVKESVSDLSNLSIEKEVSKNITLAESKIEKSLLQFDQENVKESVSVYKLFHISENEGVLVLPSSASVFFIGAIKVEVLIGKLSVLGCELSPDSQLYTVYSPYGDSLLSLQECEQNDKVSLSNYLEQVRNIILSLKVDIKKQETILQNVTHFSSILLLQSVSEPLVSLVNKYMPQVRFPTHSIAGKSGEDVSRVLRTVFVKEEMPDHKLYNQPKEWNSLVQGFLKCKPGTMRIMAFGGKGVGKSTFLRFLVNQFILKFKKVLYIDFDVGQCEFSPPGCVSAVVVENPLLGPNFTHLTDPDRMVYVGDIDVSRCVDHYLQGIQYIHNWCCSQAHLTNIPWLINTMGFIKGLGAELAVTLIKLVSPSDVIQIESTVNKRNFRFPLTHDIVKTHVNYRFNEFNNKNQSLKYDFHRIPSVAETFEKRNCPWGVHANVARDTALLAYFSPIIIPPVFSLLEVIPQALPFSKLKLCVSHEKLKYVDYVSAFNGNVVGLCCAPSEIPSLKPSDPSFPEIVIKPIFHCLGFGIVRGVDIEKRLFFITTPVPLQMLNEINCLVLGNVHLPECVYISQDEAEGCIPYVTEGSSFLLGRGVQAAKPVIKSRRT